MRKPLLFFTLIFSSLLLLEAASKTTVWGFYAHKIINQKAIFLLPIDLIPTFKLNLEEIRHFSIAPDQRRHSSPHEAVRHYMDLDHWGSAPFSNVPRKYKDAVWKFADVYFFNDQTNDTLHVNRNPKFINSDIQDSIFSFFYKDLRYSDRPVYEWNLANDDASSYFENFEELKNYNKFYFRNHLDEYGILPYHLVQYQNRLKWAFIDQNIPDIIRLAGELGHYIGDAHVPLHTTLNYNGQMTGQDGIHAFWETRIPELFATEDYDFWTEPRSYIDDKETFFWNIVLESHDLVDDVLGIEMNLRSTFPKDNQYCFGERLGVTQRIECEAYAKAYQEAMNGMVENRMRDAITAIASCWYTAWVDAGSPTLSMEKVTFDIPIVVAVDSLKIEREDK